MVGVKDTSAIRKVICDSTFSADFLQMHSMIMVYNSWEMRHEKMHYLTAEMIYTRGILVISIRNVNASVNATCECEYSVRVARVLSPQPVKLRSEVSNNLI